MKRVLLLSLCVLVLSGLAGCRETEITDKSMYSDNEQVGSLGKSYTKNDEQITTHSGDIVLYSGDKIVVFYGSNSWAYTRLGKMNIPEGDVTELLSNGDITLKIVIAK